MVVLTAYSESNTKLLGHLRTLAFFDEALVGDAIEVVSLQQYLAQGLEATAAVVVAEARRRRQSLVVLDGFRGVQALDPAAGRGFLYDLGTGLSLRGATTLITAEAEPREAALFPEATTADVLVGMHYGLDGARVRRGIEAIKVRGAAPLLGLHGLTLGAAGVVVSPRLEARVVAAARVEPSSLVVAPPPGPDDDRAGFDLPALDALLGGGLSRMTATLVVGSPGTGKTSLGLRFALAGVRAGEPVLFLSFNETREELLRLAAPFVFGPEVRRALEPGGGLTLLRRPAVELDPDVLADDLLTALDQTGARRLIVDSLADVERAVRDTGDARREANYLSALIKALRAREVTALFIKSNAALAAADLALSADLFSLVAPNVLWLQQVTYGERLHRVLSVPKMRYSAHDTTLREFTISAPAGLQVLAPFETAAGVLAGIARTQERARAAPGTAGPVATGNGGAPRVP